MDKKLEQELINKYPTFFRDMYGDSAKTCMAYGCTHGDGWFYLLKELCETITTYLDDKPDLKARFRFSRIKEKFGLLTIYVAGADDFIYSAIRIAENKSAHVCEMCGAVTPDVETKGSWLRTLCINCRELS